MLNLTEDLTKHFLRDGGCRCPKVAPAPRRNPLRR